MPYFVLNRDYTLRTTHGFTVGFVKGEPTWVPPAAVPDAVAIGAEPQEGAKSDVLGPEVVVVAEPTHDERKNLIYAAFAKIAAKNDSKDFTGSGVPNVKAVERAVPFAVDRNEIVELWGAYVQSKAA